MGLCIFFSLVKALILNLEKCVIFLTILFSIKRFYKVGQHQWRERGEGKSFSITSKFLNFQRYSRFSLLVST